MRSFAAACFPLLLLLLIGSMGACQRASYQFQNQTPADSQVASPSPSPESAVVLVAIQPNEPVPKSQRAKQRSTRRSAKRPQLPRPQAILLPSLPLISAAKHLAVHNLRSPWKPAPVAQSVRRRSRGLAIVLAALAVTYLPFSLHNFYLGYYGRGAVAISLLLIGAYLVQLSAIGIFFSSPRFLAISYLGVIILVGWFIWQLSDLLRIIRGDLKPKDGEYT